MAAIAVVSQIHRSSVSFTAGASIQEYNISPLKGRPEDSYFALLNTGAADLDVAFGEPGVEPALSGFFTIKALGSFEPLLGFLAKGQVNMFVTGTDTFTIIN